MKRKTFFILLFVVGIALLLIAASEVKTVRMTFVNLAGEDVVVSLFDQDPDEDGNYKDYYLTSYSNLPPGLDDKTKKRVIERPKENYYDVEKSKYEMVVTYSNSDCETHDDYPQFVEVKRNMTFSFPQCSKPFPNVGGLKNWKWWFRPSLWKHMYR